MSSALHIPPPPPAGLDHGEHAEVAPPTRLQCSYATGETAASDRNPLDPRLSHVVATSSRSSSGSDRAGHVRRPAEVASLSTIGRCQAEHKRFIGTAAVALQPPPPLWMQHSTAAPTSAVPLPSSSVPRSLLDKDADDGGETRSRISSSHSSSLTSSHYLLAIQQDLEDIVRLQKLQLQERGVPLSSEASTTESVPRVRIGAEQTVAAPSAASLHRRLTAPVEKANPAMRLESIERAKHTWLEGEAAMHTTLRQQQSQQPLHRARHAQVAVASVEDHHANTPDAASQLSLGPWQSSSQATSGTLLSLPPHEVSGLSIPAGAGISVTHHPPLQQQQQPQPPPPPPSSSPIPASLVEYQGYLMQLEHQQRQHREVLRRQRKQRKEGMVAAQRRATIISVPATTATPPRQRTGVGASMEDRRDRSPPLAMMLQTMRQRRVDGRGMYSVDTMYGDTSSSATTSTAASSEKQQRCAHSQKPLHPVTLSTAAAAAPSSDRGGSRQASASRSRSADAAGLSAATPARVPAVGLIDAPRRSSHRRRTLQLERLRETDARHSATNSSSRRLSQQQRPAVAPKGEDGQRLPPQASPLIVNSLTRSVPPAPEPTEAALPQRHTDAAVLMGPQSSPVEAFADALLMDARGTVGAGGGISAAGPLPPPLMGAHAVAGTVVTAVGGTAVKTPPIIFSTSSSGAVATRPGDVDDAHRSKAEVAPATEEKHRRRGSREQQEALCRESSGTTMTTTTPASSAGSSPSRERGVRAVREDGGARMRTGDDCAAPDAASPAYSRHQQRSHIAERIFLQSSNGFHWRVARRRSRGAGATTAAADAHHSHPDGHRRHRHHLHCHHRSMEGISSTIPEHGTGTPRSSRYRYNSSSTARQPKQLRRTSRHSPRNAGVADTRGDCDGGGIKRPVSALVQRPVSAGGCNAAHRRVTDHDDCRGATAKAAAASNELPASSGMVSRRAHPQPRPPSRSSAAVWRDVKRMWAPAAAARAPFAAVYHYHPCPCPSGSCRGQQQQQSSSSALAGASESSARAYTTDYASASAVREAGAAQILARAGRAAPSPLSAAVFYPHQQKASANAPLLCMTDSLIGAALRDVLPVCRARQRKVAREVDRRRYQLPPTVVGVAASSTAL
ncbi:hypothetical protein LSCM1_07086 [Leishmania martiniquensis]|uniref:Uncharacterized protein n=1 Tax=Leishmania martiniquensis TaxID=1580590 RepID=A0A836HVG7_9TRYP|nr:hypothetical protein LSCM1_07086 [Leishmania martiniquensis]